MRVRARHPVFWSLASSVLVYVAFLLWPGSDWWLRLSTAVDWVGGALVIVGPLAAAGVCAVTQRLLAHLRSAALTSAAFRRMKWQMLGGPLLLHVALHVAVLAIAVLGARALGAGGSLMAGLALRQIAALGFFAAVGHVVGVYAPGAVAPALVAVGTFLLPMLDAALGSGMLTQTGGLAGIGGWAAVSWPHVGAQIALWTGVLLLASAVHPWRRTVSGPWAYGAVVVGLAGVVIAAPGIPDSDFTAIEPVQRQAVACRGAAPQVCVSRGSEFWRDELTSAAQRIDGELRALGARPVSAVVEVGPPGSTAVPTPALDGDVGDARRVSLDVEFLPEGRFRPWLVDAIVNDSTCADGTGDVPLEALAWLYARLGEDLYPDLTAQVVSLPEGGRPWLRSAFDGARSCSAVAFDEVPS